jgi:hypothetical protein
MNISSYQGLYCRFEPRPKNQERNELRLFATSNLLCLFIFLSVSHLKKHRSILFGFLFSFTALHYRHVQSDYKGWRHE